jgi:hypothetical protein
MLNLVLLLCIFFMLSYIIFLVLLCDMVIYLQLCDNSLIWTPFDPSPVEPLFDLPYVYPA